MDAEEDNIKLQCFLENLKSKKTINFLEEKEQVFSVPKNVVCEKGDKEVKNLQRCLECNAESQSLLSSLELSLRCLLEECLKEQKKLREQIDNYENQKCTESNPNKQIKPSFLRKICTSPYFKDSSGFPSPHNKDVFIRSKMGYLNPWTVVKKSGWTDEEKRNLEKSIRNDKKEGTKTLSDYKYVPTEINDSKSPALLTGSSEDYDWDNISVTELNCARSPSECQAIWVNYLDPKINKGRWSCKESEKLEDLVEKYQYQDWESIANALGTKRSAYQCIAYYKIKLADFSRKEWTKNELKLLAEYVNKFRISQFIPWFKIAWIMDGRRTGEVHKKWCSLNGVYKKGTFSLQEDLVLVAGLKEFGEDWNRIAYYLPTRQSVQVRGRLMVLKGRDKGLRPWTPHEDQLLEDLVQKYGYGNWAKISTHFLSRNNVQIRSRYKSLVNWKTKHGVEASTKTAEGAPKDSRTVDSLWEMALNILNNKINPDLQDPSFQGSMLQQLLELVRPRKKPGRKQGTTSVPPDHKSFYDFFHVAHCQRGGRGKDTCTKEKLASMVQHIIFALRILDAKITLPCVNDIVWRDNTILEMDKSVLTFLIDRKDLLKCSKYIQFEKESMDCNSNSIELTQKSAFHSDPENRLRWYPLCPPSGSTMIGLRTMLLNRFHIRDQSNGRTEHRDTVTPDLVTSYPTKSENYRSACKLWNKRIGILFTWTALISKLLPHEQSVIHTETKMVERKTKSETKRSKPAGRGKKRGKKASKLVNPNERSDQVSVPPPTKRPYVKSGKFSLMSQVSGSERIGTRRSSQIKDEDSTMFKMRSLQHH